MALIKNLKTALGQILYPITKAKCVYTEDNTTVEDALSELNNNLSEIGTLTLLGTFDIDTTTTGGLNTIDTSPYKYIYVEVVNSNEEVVYAQGYYPVVLLPTTEPSSGYNYMFSLYHSTSWTMYMTLTLIKTGIRVRQSSNSWSGSVTKYKVYGIQ